MPYPQRCRDQMQASPQSALVSLIVQSLKYAQAPARVGFDRDANPESALRQPAAIPSQVPASDHAALTGSWNERSGRGERA